ncbi:hypothetical protein COX05_02740 [candidate division WWE3 bacterium CG22_combo_CG10-13_8_21_14_all_39_12]|uniref:SWIM-type domain-containing protein n=2 Tax=Katanobacteria TaxID=422282 RepID=A0A2M7X2T7_UNCKA|nr:MAG: hypothetical protein COX05_02740 [candidate division WWE3 bacterium CG22_combo_CG10-13_8_21_14_all_39_12]PJA40419.1 MAG: hypothetical protein CO179_02325 [candidate division WWE3 bacterium CG_4_9_14_3_um_filter_39_7]
MNKPRFTFDKIKYATDTTTFDKAVALYEKGSVIDVKDNGFTYSAKVLGTQPYDVVVSHKAYDNGDCTCYLGQNGVLCKHMVALALYIVKGGKTILTDEDKSITSEPGCSGICAVLSKDDLSVIKQEITSAMKCIKAYDGPSRTWFANQNSVEEGCKRLSVIVSKLPVSKETSDLLVTLLLRLERKIYSGGVDDSNGFVSGFMVDLVVVLQEFVKLDEKCKKSFEKLKGLETTFGWEEPLVELIDNG